ncbi:MAG TPA: NAD(P) transhydrogenase subunit alpha [Spirochaetota bacterium]|nr:NAD(P) transhydrogenase subunit alpha [Spirochaetota bacterium]
MNFSGLTVGIPREIMEHEFRVAAIPETVKKLVSEGAKVLVEAGAGSGAHFYDDEYRAAGAEIVDDCEKLYAQADIVMKVKEPLYNEAKKKHEVALMKKGQLLVTFLHPASPSNHGMIGDLARQGVTGLTLDGIPRITRAQSMDALTSMSTVAGYKGVIMAADDLTKFLPMVGTAVGVLQPSQVFVVGAGVAGLQALATAKRLGAMVFAADIRPEAAEQAKSLGAKIVDTLVPRDMAVGTGGYALALPDEWLEKERAAIRETVKKSDIVVLSALVPGKIAPILVTEEMVKEMKSGSVIVDIAVDQGGNCEATDPGRTSVKHGVTIIGTKNIPGYVPTSSTWMFAHNIYNLVSYLVKDGKIRIDRSDEIVASTLVTIDGKLVHAGALEAMAAPKKGA